MKNEIYVRFWPYIWIFIEIRQILSLKEKNYRRWLFFLSISHKVLLYFVVFFWKLNFNGWQKRHTFLPKFISTFPHSLKCREFDSWGKSYNEGAQKGCAVRMLLSQIFPFLWPDPKFSLNLLSYVTYNFNTYFSGKKLDALVIWAVIYLS